jgi:hypothetical protein
LSRPLCDIISKIAIATQRQIVGRQKKLNNATRGLDGSSEIIMKFNTHSLAFFLGPGFPLTLGTPSGSKATAELLLPPFFLTTSVGGGIDEGAGVPVAAGVLDADPTKFSPFKVAGTGKGVMEEASLIGDSSLMSDAGPDFASSLDDSFNTMINDAFDDFRRAVEAVDGCFVEAIVELRWACEECEEVGVAGSRLEILPTMPQIVRRKSRVLYCLPTKVKSMIIYRDGKCVDRMGGGSRVEEDSGWEWEWNGRRK